MYVVKYYRKSHQLLRKANLFSPIKVVKEPDGSLAHAATVQTQMSRERREARDAAQQSLLDSIPRDMARPWEDPNPEDGERLLAQSLRGIGHGGFEAPEWRKQMDKGGTGAYGFRDQYLLTYRSIFGVYSYMYFWAQKREKNF